ncbi:MAG: carboxylating nicotinate-nucleotide diphosphorylase [Phycisphaerales bacterium JB063]
MPDLTQFITPETLSTLIQTARLEDLCPSGLDVTSACFIPETSQTTTHIVPRERGILAGLATLDTVCRIYSDAVTLERSATDGDPAEPGQSVATLQGPTRDVLAIERVALNLLTHLSGIASLTAQYVARCEGTKARIYDTRKTLPGLRGLQKYAVACGGGGTHRMGLCDAVLVKDNHLAGIALEDLAARLTTAHAQAHQLNANLAFFQVEVDNLLQLEAVLKAPVDIVLLDNMPNETLRDAVAMRDASAPNVELEASGGVNLHTVKAIAHTGVDRISVGALTHSAKALDIGLDIR